MRQRLISAPSSAPPVSRPSTPVSADQREAHPKGPVHRGPLSLFIVTSSERQRFVKGGVFAGLRTLDKSLPLRTIQVPGKGGRGLRGLAPWRSLRQRLIRAFHARASRRPLNLFSWVIRSACRFLFALLGLLAIMVFRALSPYFHPHSVCGPWPRCPLVFSMQWGAAISVAAWRLPSALTGPPQPRSHPKLGASHNP